MEWVCLPPVPSLAEGPLRTSSLLAAAGGGGGRGAGATWSVSGDRTLPFPWLQLRPGRIPSSASPVMTCELGRELPVLVPFPLSVDQKNYSFPIVIHSTSTLITCDLLRKKHTTVVVGLPSLPMNICSHDTHSHTTCAVGRLVHK